nr:type IV conjugative transfer system coupling protein TraD [Legionella fairfieldensis]
MNRYPVENLLREATEFYSAITFFSLALMAWLLPHLLLLTEGMSQIALLILLSFGLYRFVQGYRIKRYQYRLKTMPYYGLSTREIPLSRKELFLGRGFLWTPLHTQRLHQIKQVANQRFLKTGRLYRLARLYTKRYPKSWLTALLNHPTAFNPLRPLPDVGGKPYLHGLGNQDKSITLGQGVRVGHTFVLGTTRVGKTRLASVLINQDIRNGDAVIVVDPKGDLDLVRDMYSACLASNRLADFKIIHLGYPEVSASYNPLKNFDQITEVATRITDAINADGEGKQFADFAWKYANVVGNALLALNEPITYREIGFYITRLDLLLMRYCDHVFAHEDANYLPGVDAMIAENDAKVDKVGNPYPPMERSKAVLKYVKAYVSDMIQNGDIKAFQGNLLLELYDAASLDKQYYDKITASLGPVLAKINSSNASDIFSTSRTDADISLMDVIKHKQVLYIGLDSLSNATVASDVGKAFLSDLVSTAGKIYKEPNAKYTLNLHCDELSEIIQEAFVKILNKAGGAGFQVTAYAQTKQDLEVALGSRAMAEMTEGNLNTLIMLRVKNTDTAKVLTDMLPSVDVVSHTQVSMVNDTPHGTEQVYFNTSNEDRVQMTSVPMIEPSDVAALPKGQAFVLANGGELYKIRIPLPINDGLAPDDVVSAMRELNFKKQPLTDKEEQASPPESSLSQLSDSHSEQSDKPVGQAIAIDAIEPVVVTQSMGGLQAIQTIAQEVLPQDEAQGTVLHNAVIDKEKPTPIEPQLKSIELEEAATLRADFTGWLEKRMNSNNRAYQAASQRLVKTNHTLGNDRVFVCEEVLIKYQSRSGIEIDKLGGALTTPFKPLEYFVQDSRESLRLYPVQLSTPIECPTSSAIEVKGE